MCTPLRLAVAVQAMPSHSERLPGDSSSGKAENPDPSGFSVFRLTGYMEHSMSRYRVHYIEGSNENLRIRKEQIVEAPSFQDALERFTYWPAAEDCEQAPACAPHSGTNLCHMEAWEVFPVEGI